MNFSLTFVTGANRDKIDTAKYHHWVSNRVKTYLFYYKYCICVFQKGEIPSLLNLCRVRWFENRCISNDVNLRVKMCQLIIFSGPLRPQGSTVGIPIEEESDRREGKGRRCWLGTELIQFHAAFEI